jgi:hypothetical protein
MVKPSNRALGEDEQINSGVAVKVLRMAQE